MRLFSITLLLVLSTSVLSQTLEEGILLFEKEQFGESKKVFEQLLKNDPNNAPSLYYLGRIAFEENEHKEALEWFEKALAKKSDSPLFTMWVGNALGRMAQNASVFKKAGYAKKCIAHYEKAIELDPTFIPARFRAIDFYVEAPGMVGGGRDKAETQVEEIESIDPKEAYMARGIIHSFFKEEDALVANYESAIASYPEFMPPYFELFEFHYQQKQYDAAASVAKAQLAVNDTTEVIKQNLDRALEHLE